MGKEPSPRVVFDDAALSHRGTAGEGVRWPEERSPNRGTLGSGTAFGTAAEGGGNRDFDRGTRILQDDWGSVSRQPIIRGGPSRRRC